jgi:hypothetical protein
MSSWFIIVSISLLRILLKICPMDIKPVNQYIFHYLIRHSEILLKVSLNTIILNLTTSGVYVISWICSVPDLIRFWDLSHCKTTLYTYGREQAEKTTDLPKVTDKLYHIMLYWVNLAWAGFELTTLMVIDTECIGSYKLNYSFTILTTYGYFVDM